MFFKLTLLGGIIITLSLTFHFFRDTSTDILQSELFTVADLAVMESISKQSLTVGYVQGHDLGFKNALQDVLTYELALEIDFISYESDVALMTATETGEVDFFITLPSEDVWNMENFFSFPMLNTVYVITHQDHTIDDVTDLNTRQAGFLTDSILQQDFYSHIYDYTFFDSLDDVLTALENKEIDAFITRTDHALDALIERKNLQMSLTLQLTFLELGIGTSHVELEPVLNVFKEIMNSHRAAILRQKVAVATTQNRIHTIKDYVHEHHEDALKSHNQIIIGHHDASFPYSYFQEDGTSTGIFIEMLDFFQHVTGIEYTIKNERGQTNYSELFQRLKHNDLQFLFGIGHVHRSEEVIQVGEPIRDNLISFTTYENRYIGEYALADLRFGILTSPANAKQILGSAYFTTFNDYTSAAEALLENQVNILLGRQSLLAYYRYVENYAGLVQIDLISIPSFHSILGNYTNESLNSLMADIQRIHPLVSLSDPGVVWANQATSYQNRYLQLRTHQAFIIRMQWVAVAGVTTLIVFLFLLLEKKQNRFLRLETERDKLTNLYTRGTYEKKCLSLIQRDPHSLGIFFFFDLDNLKVCNDSYGHDVGDRLIIKFANQLKTLEDNRTICFRIAGDEFGVFRMGFQNENEIREMIASMKEVLSCEVKVNEKTSIPVKYSAGGSIYNQDTTDFEELKRYADYAMYQAKNEKKAESEQASDTGSVKLYITLKQVE